MYKFYALRLVSIILRTLGWLAALVGILTIILPYIPENIYQFVKDFDELYLYQQAQKNNFQFFCYGVTIFIGGIVVAGFGDLFKVFIAIADNTRFKTNTKSLDHKLAEFKKQ